MSRRMGFIQLRRGGIGPDLFHIGKVDGREENLSWGNTGSTWDNGPARDEGPNLCKRMGIYSFTQ